MELELSGKRALITGASRGIGLAIAQVLAKEGCSLVLTARDPDRLAESAEMLRTDHGVEVEQVAADLTMPGEIDRMAGLAGPLDILINNAGAIPNGTLQELDAAKWRSSWELKVFGYIDLTRAIYPGMVERGRGVVLNIIGMAGERPSAWYIAGSTGNASLYTFTRALGADSFDHGVRVLGLSPGYIETDRQRVKMMNRAEAELGDRERWREFAKNLPQSRLAQPREVADVAAFLVSDRASFISGTVVTVDGGMASRPALI
ncbi:short-chain dehydrogenase/reductase [uncultured Enterovirga sp.]|uniref:short-chain dehydrogenase/reductase n=1 Tax=uncultured Enterovirga sp. TaxID=2026352 RepID=UPI0035CB2F47